MDPNLYGPSYKTYNMNLPVTTGPASVSSLSGGSGMGPIVPMVAGSFFKGVSDYLTARSDRKEREKERELRERQFRAEEARRRAVAEQVRPLFENLQGLDFSSIGGQQFGQSLSEQERLRRILEGR